jgi:hypothetical protein
MRLEVKISLQDKINSQDKIKLEDMYSLRHEGEHNRYKVVLPRNLGKSRH